MLSGDLLLQLVKGSPDLSRTELAKKAGYVRVTEDGKEQVLLQQFYDACFTAHGTPIKSGRGLHGKPVAYQTTVHQSGILLIGNSYTKEFGADPGDVFGIEVREDGIWLPLKERDPKPKAAKGSKLKAVPNCELAAA